MRQHLFLPWRPESSAPRWKAGLPRDPDADLCREQKLVWRNSQPASASSSSVAKLVPALADYDEAVAVQASSNLEARGVHVQDQEIRALARQAGAHVERGFDAFVLAWRECELARRGLK
jgi:hypothetical protein